MKYRGAVSGKEAIESWKTTGKPANCRDRTDTKRIDFSVVIPFHNEEVSVRNVIEECLAVFGQLPDMCCEILAVDDGSKDDTGTILKALSESDSRVRILTFPQNRGQAPALYHGLKDARGGPRGHPRWRRPK